MRCCEKIIKLSCWYFWFRCYCIQSIPCDSTCTYQYIKSLSYFRRVYLSNISVWLCCFLFTVSECVFNKEISEEINFDEDDNDTNDYDNDEDNTIYGINALANHINYELIHKTIITAQKKNQNQMNLLMTSSVRVCICQ